MDVCRPVQGGVQGFGGVWVVVAWGQKHRAGDGTQGLGEGLSGLPISLPSVQQIPRQEEAPPPPRREPPPRAEGRLGGFLDQLLEKLHLQDIDKGDILLLLILLFLYDQGEDEELLTALGLLFLL